MTKPVGKGGIAAQLGITNNGVEAGLGIKVSAKLPARQNAGAIRQVNQQLSKNPNHARGNAAHQNQPHVRNNNSGHGNNQNVRGNQNNQQTVNNPTNPKSHGSNGAAHASQQGLEHGRGHHKGHGAGQSQPPNNTTKPNNTGNQPNTTSKNDLPNQGNTTKTTNLPPPTQPQQPTNLPQTPQPQPQQPTTNLPQNQLPQQPTTHHFPNAPTNLPANVQTRENLQNSLLRLVFGQVLQQNDIYLSNRSVNQLIDNHSNSHHPNHSNAAPKKVSELLQNIGKTIFGFVHNSSNLDGKMIHQVATELAHQFHEEIQASKNLLLNTAGLDGKHFEQLNIRERMQAAVDLLPRHIPAGALESLQNHTSQEILNGLMLARGFVAANENTANAKSLAALTNVLANEIPPAALRDIGHLVKILIADAASAKSTVNLDLAVQKFVRFLLANNELGVLLAVVSLAGQNQANGGLVSRSLALAQIYEMINRLIMAGEKAMNEAMPKNASENVLKNEKNSFISFAVNANETDDTNLNLNKTGQTGAESALRQFLEFNPAFMQDNSASAFTNSDDARQAQKDFVSAYQTEIEQWLRSGNHRLVKDIEFEKPLGIVVERDSDGYFSANKARIVLVRDGSVTGWHFLKSFLVS